MNAKIKQRKYTFKGRIWKYKGKAGWHFVTLPKSLSKTIRRFHGLSEEGWGRLKVDAAIDEIKWRTAIWFDTKFASYLLPIKSAVRKRADISEDQRLSITLCLEIEDSRFSIFRT